MLSYRLWLLAATLTCILPKIILSQPSAQTFFPASIPLAIRSPYNSLWYDSQAGASPMSNSWPLFWGRQDILDVQTSIRVDGETFLLTGIDNPLVGDASANVLATVITPTRTIFIMQAGPMNVTVTFTSPIDPSDWVALSFPFFYVSVEAASLDGRPHDIQVYSEIAGGWLSINGNTETRGIQYKTNTTLIESVQFMQPQRYVEYSQQAQDGEAYIAMSIQNNQTWQIDNHEVCRRTFHDKGVLSNGRLPTLPLIGVNVTVFAISVDLGQIQETSAPQVWAIGFARDPSISYTTPDGEILDLSPYYATRYPRANINQAIDDFVSGFPDAQRKAIALDDAIIGNASAISTWYADLVSLATRSTMGSLDITVSTGTDERPNASDTRIFMKDIASTEQTGRVNPVEKMFGALPLLLYLNASLVGPLLSPLLDAQDNLVDPPYAAQDIGLAYPNATGTHGEHNQGVEQTGNMLIMLYAHARFSGDGSLIYKHVRPWQHDIAANFLTSVDYSTTSQNVGQTTSFRPH
ncbi:hypothetical protein BC628DRAFT_1314099 [Trametes gibbosa]|nr:hypothetical protein BC628DRAFT_1314099 [Trametes gibbosa]